MKIVEFLKAVRNIPYWDRCPAISDEELDRLIEQVEPADCVVTGTWIGRFNRVEIGSHQKVFDCSVCQKTEFYKHPYCPRCGAKMDMRG